MSLFAAFAFGLLATCRVGCAQVVINANDDVTFRLGVLADFQADTIDVPQEAANTNNLFIRRVRVLVGRQVARNVTFFIEAGTPNLGKTLASGKNIEPAAIIQDAYGEFTVTEAFAPNRKPFPASATSHAACRFTALRAPAPFTSRVMKPLEWEPLSVVATCGQTRSRASATAAITYSTVPTESQPSP